jgi:LAO/AO transport system ATPase
MLDDLLARFRQHDRLALSRLLSYLARGEHCQEITAKLGPAAKPARVVALTGSAGVGKSTLVGKLIERIRAGGQSVAVLACDPQSPLSGGALLGDRFRMPNQPDDGVFIRSLAAASGHGAIAEHLPELVRLLEAFGFDLVLIETVGAGQGDTAVHELADVVVLLLQPETGDDLQWEKAGVLEIADVVVVNKADLPRADHVEAQVRAALMPLNEGPTVPVLRVSGRTGEGVETLLRTINSLPLRPRKGEDRELLQLGLELLTNRYQAAVKRGDERLQELNTEWRQGRLSAETAATELLRLLIVITSPSGATAAHTPPPR